MDINIFIIFLAFALVLSLSGYFLKGNLGLSLAFLSGGIFIVLGMMIWSGETITHTVYFDPSTYITYAYDLGISTTDIMIFFALMGILNIMTAVADWLG